MESIADWAFAALTGFVAWYGLSFRDEAGRFEPVRLIFGLIGLLFFARVVLGEILDVW